jgi:hypothetical protein
MTRLNALCAAAALPTPRPTPTTIRRLPTAYEQEHHTRWVPGLGFGLSLFHWPPRPYLFLTLFRWRR